MGGVHELQLLPGEQEEQRHCQQERGQTDRDHARPPSPGSSPAWLGDSKFARRVLGIPVLSHPTAHVKHPPSCILCPDSRISQARTTPRGIHPASQTLPSPIPYPDMPHPASHLLYPSNPPPIFHTLHPAPHLEPGLAPYPAERQLDDMGSVAGDYPWEEEEEKDTSQKRWSQSAPRLLDAHDAPGERK